MRKHDDLSQEYEILIILIIFIIIMIIIDVNYCRLMVFHHASLPLICNLTKSAELSQLGKKIIWPVCLQGTLFTINLGYLLDSPIKLHAIDCNAYHFALRALESLFFIQDSMKFEEPSKS